MKDYKVYVKDEETSNRVYNYGVQLKYRGNRYAEGKSFLYFNSNDDITFDSKKSARSFPYFKQRHGKELTPEEFLALPLPKQEIKTELEAVEISMKLWKWLMENPTKEKEDYPEFVSSGTNEMQEHCSMCEYWFARERGRCSNCILGIKKVCSNIEALGWANWNNGINKAHNAGLIYHCLKDRCDELKGKSVKQFGEPTGTFTESYIEGLNRRIKDLEEWRNARYREERGKYISGQQQGFGGFGRQGY
jgi:hypothetical protein